MSENWSCARVLTPVPGLLFILVLTVPAFSRILLVRTPDRLSPDPAVPMTVEVRQTGLLGSRTMTDYSVEVLPAVRAEIIRTGGRFFLVSSSVTNSGSFSLIVRAGRESVTDVISFRDNTSDSDGDGYPDAAELGNSPSFREWFCSIAESQFFHPSDAWYDVKKDCAGLVEFAYREALKKHDRSWAGGYKFLSDAAIPDDRKYNYPDVPLIGRRIFRVKPGPFRPDRVASDFSGSANGSLLREYSMEFVTRDISSLKKGDLIFFLHPDNMTMPSHAMIFTGSRVSSDPRDGYLVYHTGPGPTNRGFIKKVQLRDLMKHPDPSWRPVPENDSFLGVYKWKIID